MTHANQSVLTLEQLNTHVGTVSGGASAADIASSLSLALDAYGDRIKGVYYLTLPIPCFTNTLDLSELGVYDVGMVWYRECDDAPWMKVKWWEYDNHTLKLDPFYDYCAHGASVMIEHWERPPGYRPTSGTLSQQFNYANATGGEVHVTLADTSGVPASGYVLIGTSPDSQWFEYQAVYQLHDPVTEVILMLTAKQPWAHQPGTVLVGEPIEWGIPFPTTMALHAITAQAASYYWANQTGKCTNDDDRSSAMQLMNFWSSEAEKAWTRVKSPRKARTIRKSDPRGYYAFASN